MADKVPLVAVIDLLSKKDIDESDLDILAYTGRIVDDYSSVGRLCDDCKLAGRESLKSLKGINAHGIVCANITSLSDLHEAQTITPKAENVSPPRLALIAAGCSSCSESTESDLVSGISEAVDIGANVISLSVIRTTPPTEVDPEVEDYHERDYMILYATERGVCVVAAAGNFGNRKLQSVQKSGPWYITVGSVSTNKRYCTDIQLSSAANINLPDHLKGYSYGNAFEEARELRVKGDITRVPCVMYSDGRYIFIEKADGAITTNINPLSLVFISAESSTMISYSIEQAIEKDLVIRASFKSVPRDDNDHDIPLVSNFSGRGPCCYYKENMKPDLCAPGEQIVTAYPEDADGNPSTASYSVLSGTSYSTPYVAAGVAAVMWERKFSVSATISAAITTADTMGTVDYPYEFAYGAGVFNREKAMRPGLVYEQESGSFYEYLLGHTDFHANLNLAYFSATFPSNNGKWVRSFSRKLKNVEKGRCTYKAKVVVHATTLDMSRDSISINVTPETLRFADIDAEQRFMLNVCLPHTKSKSEDKLGVVSGSLIWTNDSDASLVVTSPIILSTEVVTVVLNDPGTL